MSDPSMNLYEELLLIALQDDKGMVRLSHSVPLHYGLAGALIMELMFDGNLIVRDKKLHVANPSPKGDELPDEALKKIDSSKQIESAKFWVFKLAGKIKKLKERVALLLIDKEILEKESGKKFLIIPATEYKMVAPTYEAELKARIRAAVLGGEEPDQRLAALMCLIYASELQNEIFSKDERRDAKKRMKEIPRSGAVDESVAQAVEEIRDATIAAISAHRDVA